MNPFAGRGLRSAWPRRRRMAIALTTALVAGAAAAVPAAAAIDAGAIEPAPAVSVRLDAPAADHAGAERVAQAEQTPAAPAPVDAARQRRLDEGGALVQGWLDDLTTLRARFAQTLYDGDGRLLSQSSGRMLLRRPGRFRWEVEQPYPQLMVADGEDFWVYDPDLEQVTVRPLGESLADTPASLLVGDGDFREQFAVMDTTREEDGAEVVRLEPRAAGADFAWVALRFRDGALLRIEAMDRLDQLTRIDFEAIERDVRLARRLFRFDPPADADVIDRRHGSS